MVVSAKWSLKKSFTYQFDKIICRPRSVTFSYYELLGESVLFKANCVCLSSPLLDLPACPWGWPCPVPIGGFLTPKPFLVLDRLQAWLDPKRDLV